MEFSHLLRIDGKFKGRLSVSQNGDNSPSIITDNMGDLIIGEHGILIGDVGDSCNIRCMMMEGGEVIGNISVEELVLLNNAKVSGKITAKFCTIGENAVVFTGGESVNIHPQAPEVVDDLVLGHSESNESLIFKQELDNSPYASKPNQKRQVVMEKKVRGDDLNHGDF
jgi:cytoskeletal protein CcmA (bactofilin family)